MSNYRQETRYRFEVNETRFVITDWGSDWLYIEEVRKNSQEDSHMVGGIVLKDDGPEWEDKEVAEFLGSSSNT